MAERNKTSLLAQARAHGLRYVSQSGGHLTGIPARDLLAHEVGAMSVKDVELCLNSQLYEVVAGTEEGTHG